MGRRKGTTGNPNGRPKGSLNKNTSEFRDWIKELINENREKVKDDLFNAEPEKRLAFIEKLLSYVLPKPAPEAPEENGGKDSFEETWDKIKIYLKENEKD